MRTDFETIQVSVSGHVAEIILDRADTRNAFDHKMHVELADAFLALHDEPQVRAVLFAANGKVFSAGGDFDLILDDRQHPERKAEMMSEAKALFVAITELPIPVVAALHGEAVGLGATVILGCDAIVALRTARISDPHVVIGLAAGDGGCVLWPQAAGLLRAKRYLLTGDRLTAADAYAMGLITDLVDEPDLVRPTARALAERIASLPPLAVQYTKRALNQGLRQRTEEVFEKALGWEIDTFFSDDVAEAISAMRERRPGKYQGK